MCITYQHERSAALSSLSCYNMHLPTRDLLPDPVSFCIMINMQSQ